MTYYGISWGEYDIPLMKAGNVSKAMIEYGIPYVLVLKALYTNTAMANYGIT